MNGNGAARARNGRHARARGRARNPPAPPPPLPPSPRARPRLIKGGRPAWTEHSERGGAGFCALGWGGVGEPAPPRAPRVPHASASIATRSRGAVSVAQRSDFAALRPFPKTHVNI